MKSSDLPLILFYNRFWDDWVPPNLEQGKHPCRVTCDPAKLQMADAVFFHVPHLTELKYSWKRPTQWWVGVSLESPVFYPQLDNPWYMAFFDITMSFKKGADIWYPYFNPSFVPKFRRPPSPKTSEVPAVIFTSSYCNQSRRYQYLKELMRHLPIHSYGKMFNNKKLAQDEGPATKVSTISKYKFTLAFENAIDKDYVTEKFFEPLMAGSVPVVLGAPNISEFAPGEKCYIDTQDFRSPENLADHLKYLSSHPSEYETYLNWKERPFRDEFISLVEKTQLNPYEPICELLYHGVPQNFYAPSTSTLGSLC